MQERATNGLKLLMEDKSIAQVQASWRFFNNPKVTSKELFSQSCMLVWKIANDNSVNAKKLRKILIELSGKQIQRGVDWTYPALLSGLEQYLSTVDLLMRFSADEIFKMKDELSEIMGFEI